MAMKPPTADVHTDRVNTPDWNKVERMVGLPDYGVAFCVSPWPDGGWMAGVQRTDGEWVDEQDDENIDPGMKSLPVGDSNPTWSIFDGFKDGVNAHGQDAAEAIDRLWRILHGETDPPWRYETEAR